MIQLIAQKTTSKMIDCHVISSTMAEVYQYGLELLFSTILTTMSILMLACLMDSFIYGLIYFLVSTPLRMSAGGYHASTYARCFCISNLGYLAVSLATKLLTWLAAPRPLWLVLLFRSAYYILVHCPVRNPHHPVSDKTLHKNKRRAILLLCIDCSLLSLLYIKLQQSALLNLSVITILSVALFIIPTTRKGGRRHESKTHHAAQPVG